MDGIQCIKVSPCLAGDYVEVSRDNASVMANRFQTMNYSSGILNHSISVISVLARIFFKGGVFNPLHLHAKQNKNIQKI
jgi:hypothetical protein